MLGKITLFAVHRAVACVTHSRAWMPASSQMAGLSPPVLNCKRSGGNVSAAAPGPLSSTRALSVPLPILDVIERERGGVDSDASINSSHLM